MIKIKNLLLMATGYLMLFLVLFFSPEISKGAKQGVDIVFNMLLPSLFCFMILSNFIMKTRLSEIVALPFEKFFGKLFHLNKRECAIFILSLIGGYPIGAKLIASSFENGEISKEKSESLLSFFINCGPAFLISGVGAGLFGNSKLGLVIYISEVISAFFVGIIATRGFHNSEEKIKTSQHNVGTALCESVEGATKTMITIGAYSIFFSAVLPLLNLILEKLPKPVFQIASGLLEVTNGCFSLNTENALSALLFITLFTSFGGVCVIFQLISILEGSGLSLKKFLKLRGLYVSLSLALVYLYLKIFPETIECLSVNRSLNRKIYQASPIASIFLIIMSLMLLFFQRKSAKI